MHTSDHLQDPFRVFTEALSREIKACGGEGEDRTERQKAQVERLVDLEGQFRQALCNHPWGPDTYRRFISYILDERRNILAARPYFRERQKPTFAEKISPTLRARDWRGLMEFSINYVFVRFVLGCRDWERFNHSRKLIRLAGEIAEAREVLIHENTPLAINRARKFWTRVPRSHLEYMDLVQIAVEGLCNAIDKFVPPYTPVIRSVMIGRMTGNFIEEYSQPMVHFYPSDKRLIYRANKAGRKIEKGDWEKLAEAVNDGLDENIATTPSEIQLLMAAASHVSADATVGQDEDDAAPAPLTTKAAPAKDRPDYLVEEIDARRALYTAIEELPIFEQKLLVMKGVHYG